MDFSTITPEMIIDSGVRDRDWTVRTDHEKRQDWHFHVRAPGVHACVIGVAGDTETEAEGHTLDEFLFRHFEEESPEEVFGNPRWTYCATPGCDGCDLPVHVTRLQDQRLTESGPLKPTVLAIDLS